MVVSVFFPDGSRSSAGSKLDKGKALGIAIIDEEIFVKMLASVASSDDETR